MDHGQIINNGSLFYFFVWDGIEEELVQNTIWNLEFGIWKRGQVVGSGFWVPTKHKRFQIPTNYPSTPQPTNIKKKQAIYFSFFNLSFFLLRLKFFWEIINSVFGMVESPKYYRIQNFIFYTLSQKIAFCKLKGNQLEIQKREGKRQKPRIVNL